MSSVARPPQPSDILRYYRQSSEALDALKRAVVPAIKGGSLANDSQFFGMSPDEFNQALRDLLDELDYHVVMMLAASFEAVFQMDLKDRVRQKKTDDVSKALRRWWKAQVRGRKKEWINFDSLLGVWQATLLDGKSKIRKLRQLVLFRHWLAHGRYWVEKRSGLGRVHPSIAWEIGKAVFSVIPDFASLPEW